MKVLLVGNGAREHALAWKLSASKMLAELIVAPGNEGTARIGRNVPISASDFEGLLDFAVRHGVDFTVVGPETPLAAGIVDRFQNCGLPIFGPTRAAARMESSKAFAKELMLAHGVPTGSALVFDDYEDAARYVDDLSPPVVIKADGLAAGKGVVVADTHESAVSALHSMMVKGEFGAAGETVLVEQFLEGPEFSVFTFTDGRTISPLVAAVDYKRVGDGDTGPNTGGMGAYSPPARDIWNDEIESVVRDDIIEPVLSALAAQGTPYTGALYAGLIHTADGVKVIEFNCRLGDPETQVILPRIESDLLELMLAASEGRLHDAPLVVSDRSCVGVVMASGGYPGDYRTGIPIAGLYGVQDDSLIFHAGTRLDANGETVTDGGRVLTVCGTGEFRDEARQRAYSRVSGTSFEGSIHRTDIAQVA